jgi:hypothetical protein
MSTAGLPDRIARRERVARVVPDASASAEPTAAAPAEEAVPPAARPRLQPRSKTPKASLSTRISASTEQRLQQFTARGYAVTDVVDLALVEFLDRNGG